MDNRSYDPDNQPVDPLTPSGPPAEEVSHVLGEHHEQPVPVDPLRGITADPSIPNQMAPTQSWDVERPGYPEYVDKAIADQRSHSSNQPTGAAPPYTSAHPEGSAPPEQSPYSPQAYAPRPGGAGFPPPPPPEDRPRGFNWLACCGVTCGVLLVVMIAATIFGARYFKDFGSLIKSGMHIAEVADEVNRSGTPESADVTVTPAELVANPTQYEDQWIQLTGQISDDPDAMVDAFKQQRGMQETAGYLIDPNIVILDVSGSEVKAQQGDTVTVIGKPVYLDFSKLGPLAEDQVKQENKLADEKHLIFVITDDVVSGGGAGETEATFP